MLAIQALCFIWFDESQKIDLTKIIADNNRSPARSETPIKPLRATGPY